MIQGTVNANLEPTIRVTVRGRTGERDVEAVIDTGFTGFLTLPPKVIRALQLPHLCRGRAVLANGQVDVFDIHEGIVIWDGKDQEIEIESANTDALVGLSMLKGLHFQAHIVANGAVLIEPAPAP